MPFQPVMAKVNILGSKIGDHKVNVFRVVSDRHSEFNKFSDVACLVVRTIGIVHWDRNNSFLGVNLMFLDVCTVDRTSSTSAVK